MAPNNSESKYELIQNTINNPEFRSKVTRLLGEMSSSELAYLIESSPPQERKIIWDLIQLDAEGEGLGELNEKIREEVLYDMNPEEISLAISDLEVDDLADILQSLPDKINNEVLGLMNSRDRGRVANVLEFSEESAGGLMNTDIVTVRADNTIELVSRYLRFLKNIPQNTDDIYVVSKNDEYIGILPITKILTSEPSLTVRDMNEIDVYNLFKSKDLFSAPVIDGKNKLLGRITVDDILDIAVDEVEQDFIGLTQIEGDVFASPRKSIRSRLIWLTLNLLTAMSASFAISFFYEVIDKVIYAAILMPIVASMGGIAATQTLGIYIRAEALRKLNKKGIRYLFRREFIVAVVNALFFSILIFFITNFWFGDYFLSIAISLAMIINLIVAAVFGFLFPRLLRKLGYDPAISGSVVITTVTDIVGFVSFLGIVSILIL